MVSLFSNTKCCLVLLSAAIFNGSDCCAATIGLILYSLPVTTGTIGQTEL